MARTGRPRAKTPKLPDPIEQSFPSYPLPCTGWWLVLNDVHIPFHEKRTVELAIQAAKKHSARGVLLNGDILDCHELSRWDKTPDDPRYTVEVQMGRQFLAWLRHELPKAALVWKDGNHEERLVHYLISKAPALFGLDVLTLPNLLHFDRYRVQHVSDRRVITAGKLYIVHGHEFRPAISAPVNPARGLFLRAKANSLCGHHHQSSEHGEPTIGGKQQCAWSVGCACDLWPRYMPINRWVNGFALVKIGEGGHFEVRNLKVINGEVV